MHQNILNFLLLSFLIATIGCTKNQDHESNPPNQTPPLNGIEALKKNPASFSNYIQLGLAYSKEGQRQDAINAYQSAININPTAPVGWNNLCAEYNSMRSFINAESACRKALEIEPHFELAKNNLAFALSQMESYKKELIEKKNELFSKPEVSSSEFINVGLEFYSLKNYVDSVSLWNKVKEEDPLYATAQNNIASAYILTKNFIKAEKAIKLALKLEPNNQMFLNNKNWLESERKTKIK